MGEVIAKIKCPSCGQETGLKVNINGCLFINCREKLSDGSYCGYRATYGRSVSKKAYEAKENGADIGEIMEILGTGDFSYGRKDARPIRKHADAGNAGSGDGIIRPIPL